MGTCMDLLAWLERDMIVKILTCLDDPSDLVRVGAVSRSWRHFVVENSLCKHLCLRMFPQLSRVSGVVETNQKEIDDCVEVGSSSNSMEWEDMVREHRTYAFLVRYATSADYEDCILEAISASTTDNDPQESIDNTLEPREAVAQRPSYWSSTGQKDDKVPETLTYKLVSNLCVITEIDIKPFQALFQMGFPIYSAKAVRFRIGHPKSPMDEGSDSTDKLSDDKFTWTYTSKEFRMDQLSRLQRFKLPEPVLSVGGYLQVELLGRIQRQEMDGLYYICVSYVQVVGRSLAPMIDAKIINPSGKVVLKYDPKESITGTSLTRKQLLSSTTDNLERRVRTLEQIVELLRGGEFVYGWRGPDDESDEEFFL